MCLVLEKHREVVGWERPSKTLIHTGNKDRLSKGENDYRTDQSGNHCNKISTFKNKIEILSP